MEIVSFNVNSDGSALILVLEGADEITQLYLWDNYTYKDYSKKIDLTSQLDGNSSQTLTISPQDLNATYLNGVFFIEASTNSGIARANTTYLIKYKECILDKLNSLGLCNECLMKNSIDITNAHSFLIAIEYAVEIGFIEEAQSLILALDKYCSNDCKTCGKYNDILNNDYYDYNIN